MNDLFDFGKLERNVEVKINGETRSIPMLSINSGRKLAGMFSAGFDAAAKIVNAKSAGDGDKLQDVINESRNKAVDFLKECEVPEDICEFLRRYAAFEEIVAFSTYLRTGVNMLAVKAPEPDPAQAKKKVKTPKS